MFLKSLFDMLRFNALAPHERSIVFYSENGDSCPHLEGMLQELTGPMQRNVCYLTSSRDDPTLKAGNDRIRCFCIGEGEIRTSVLNGLRADVLVMTMPDLETFQIKRSKRHPVHYVYVFHSIVSTHMIYREAAFDAYDTVLCVGPHHVEEIRAWENVRGLKAKRLVEHGYGRLDTILSQSSDAGEPEPAGDAGMQVLVAPSWGPAGLLENHADELTSTLLRAGCRVTVRPHPMTVKQRADVFKELQREYGSNPAFTLETDIASARSLLESDLMISDWSGAALEYAFGLEKPVVFVDVQRKVNNERYQDIACEPLEISIRERIGTVVAPESLAELPAMLERLAADRDSVRDRIREERERSVFNLGSSARVAAECIAEIADEAASRSARDGSR